MNYSQSDFLCVEISRIDYDKWIEGMAIHRDPGDQYVMDWISANALMFRNKWESSLCKNCVNLRECGMYTKTCCDRYEFDEKFKL